jgi:hypothetical protein
LSGSKLRTFLFGNGAIQRLNFALNPRNVIAAQLVRGSFLAILDNRAPSAHELIAQ